MKSINRIVTVLSLIAVVTLTACGGGGGDVTGTGGGSTLLAASFTPALPNPGQNSVSLQEGSASGNMVTVLVQVTDTEDLTGAAFDVFYNPARFSYVSSSAGNLFESSGVTPLYGVNEAVSGHLVIGVGSGAAVPVNGSETLIRLSFRVDSQGSGPVTLDLADLQGASGQMVAGIGWHGGTLIGN